MIDTIPAELIEKYSAALPRYTSYPTAPNFSSTYGERAYKQNVRESNEALLPRDLSIYVHIPFCRSLCYFCGCNKVITQSNAEKINIYIQMLLKEIELRSGLFDKDRRVTQIHFGGGTPNFLTTLQLQTIIDKIANQFHLDIPPHLEISIEIDPRSIDTEGVAQLAETGFNRFSIGVQDFSSDVQLAVNRVQSEQSTLDIIQAANKVSPSVNVDLISGLPKQTLAGFKHTLNSVIQSGATRIAAYNFAYLPSRIKAQKLIDPKTLPEATLRTRLAETARKTLLEAGYIHIGLDHFAMPSDSLSKALAADTLQRNFQGYTTHAETDLIGFGVSAISQSRNSFAQNTTEISAYTNSLKNGVLPIERGYVLSKDDLLRSHIIQQIMCKKNIVTTQPIRELIDSQSNISLDAYFAGQLTILDIFEQDGLIKKNDGGFEITSTGTYFRRQIAAKFDQYLSSNSSQNENSSSNQAKKNIVQFSQAL